MAGPISDAAAVERFAYVFGDAFDPDDWFEGDDTTRAGLLEQRFGGLEPGRVEIRTGVVTQLLAADPPDLWAAAERLDGAGTDVEEVVDQLALVMTQAFSEALDRFDPSTHNTGDTEADAGTTGTDAGGVRDSLGDTTAFEETVKQYFLDRLVSRLDRLPLPEAAPVEAALVEAAAAAGATAPTDLVEAACTRFGDWAGDPLLEQVAQQAFTNLVSDGDGPLVPLADQQVGHVDTLRDGAVLTHVLTEHEREMGVVTVSFDLAAFCRLARPGVGGRALEQVSVEIGHLAWSGPEGWLDGFEPGTTLAVRADATGEVQLEALAEAPPVEDDLVAAVRQVCHRVADDTELPVTGEELAFSLLAQDRDVFNRPRAPLAALCEAAGLQRDGSAVGHTPRLWDNERKLHRLGRVTADARGDDDLAQQALQVLAYADGLVEGEGEGEGDGEGEGGEGEGGEGERPGFLPAADLAPRDVLGLLDDPRVTNLVTNELFDDDNWFDTKATAEALVYDLVARARSRQRSVAHYLAALLTEANRDLTGAESHLRRAVDADGENALALDRLAWYHGDKGDAAGAAKLWARCPETGSVTTELAAVAPFARSEPPGLGRNERCWCGSGRKYKQCHLGVVARPPLAERADWLWHKAYAYLLRSGPAGLAAMIGVTTSRLPEGDSTVHIRRVFTDPLTADLALTEGGWFARFLAVRGRLLPDDEALLAASWAPVRRTVFEVTAVTPGERLTLRDLRADGKGAGTGEPGERGNDEGDHLGDDDAGNGAGADDGGTVDVRGGKLPSDARTGTLLCGRVVPVDGGHRFVGGVVTVEAGTEGELLTLLDEGNPYDIAAWVGTREGAGASTP